MSDTGTAVQANLEVNLSDLEAGQLVFPDHGLGRSYQQRNCIRNLS